MLTTLGVADVELWRHLYVRDGVVSTDPLSSRVAAVCRSKFGPGVVSGRVASVLPMVSNACYSPTFPCLTGVGRERGGAGGTSILRLRR